MRKSEVGESEENTRGFYFKETRKHFSGKVAFTWS